MCENILTGGMGMDTLVELELVRLLGVNLEPGNQVVSVRVYAMLREVLLL